MTEKAEALKEFAENIAEATVDPFEEAVEAADDPSKRSFNEALAQGLTAVEELGPAEPASVFLNPAGITTGDYHGVYLKELVTDRATGFTQEKLRGITDYVAFVSSVSTLRTIDREGHSTLVKSENRPSRAASVVVIDKLGRRWEMPDMSFADAMDIEKIREVLAAPIIVPTITKGRAIMNNILHTSQRDHCQEVTLLNRTGWLRTTAEGKPRYVYSLPSGSLDAAGRAADVVTINAGTSATDPTGYMKSLGLPAVAGDGQAVKDAAEALAALLKVASPRLVLPLLGAALGAVIPQDNTPAVLLTGSTSRGKTGLMRAIRLLFSDASFKSSEWGASFTSRNTALSFANLATWHNYVPFLADDYRKTGDRDIDRKVVQEVSELIQAAYGAADRNKATKFGGIESTVAGQIAPVINGELPPVESGDAVLNRYCNVPLRPAEVEIYGIGDEENSPLTKLDRLCRKTDGLRKLSAVLVHFVARMLDEMGLQGVRDAASNHRSAWQAKALERFPDVLPRTAETCAGWTTAYRFLIGAIDNFADQEAAAALRAALPTLDEVFRIYLDSVEDNRSAIAEGSVRARILRELADTLANGKGFLEVNWLPADNVNSLQDQADPHAVARASATFKECGWIARESTPGAFEPGNRTNRLGALSADGKLVHLLSGAVSAAAGSNGAATGLSVSQLEDLFYEIEAEGHRKQKAPGIHKSAPHIFGRTIGNGYTVPAELLGLTVPGVEEADNAD